MKQSWGGVKGWAMIRYFREVAKKRLQASINQANSGSFPSLSRWYSRSASVPSTTAWSAASDICNTINIVSTKRLHENLLSWPGILLLCEIQVVGCKPAHASDSHTAHQKSSVRLVEFVGNSPGHFFPVAVGSLISTCLWNGGGGGTSYVFVGVCVCLSHLRKQTQFCG